MLALKTAEVARADVGGDGLGCGSVVGVRGEVAVLDHQHPSLAIAQQAKAKGFPQGVSGAQQSGIALAAQQIAQGVPTQFKAVLKGFDQALLLALIERWGIKEAIQLLQGSAEVGEALLPAHVCGHGLRLSIAGTGG